MCQPGCARQCQRCPAEDTLLIKSQRFDGLQKRVTEYFTKLQLIEQTLTYKIIKAVLVQDFIDCWQAVRAVALGR
nr:hypothetical protein [Streptomyces clavuligerus]